MDGRNGKEVTRVKVGKYDVPDMRIYPSLFEATKKLYESFKSEEAPDQLTAARLLGHKSVSGAFLRKVACLRAYGLVEKRGVKVTEIGKKLTYDPSEEERNKALKTVILNVPLWKEFFSQWGANPPTSNFWVELTKITGLEAPDAQKIEETVRNAYLDDVRYLKPIKKPEKEVYEVTTEAKVDTSIAIIEMKVGQYYQKLPYTTEGIKLAKGFLDLLENQLKTKPTEEIPKKETSEEEA